MKILSPDEVRQDWPRIEELLTPAFERSAGQASIQGFRNRTFSGEERIIGCYYDQKLVGCIGLAVSEFETGKRVLFLTYVGGTGMEIFLMDSIDFIKHIATDLGCSHVWTTGREGWGRAIPGMKKISTVYELEIAI